MFESKLWGALLAGAAIGAGATYLLYIARQGSVKAIAASGSTTVITPSSNSKSAAPPSSNPSGVTVRNFLQDEVCVSDQGTGCWGWTDGSSMTQACILRSTSNAAVSLTHLLQVLVEQLTRNLQFFGEESQQRIADAFVIVVGLGVSNCNSCIPELLSTQTDRLKLAPEQVLNGK
jgi:hypothetical protein